MFLTSEHNKKMKKITKALILTIFSSIIFLITGCNKDDEYPVEKGADVIRIFTRDFEDWNNELLADNIRLLNEDLTDGIQVEVEFILESAFNDKMTAARESGTAPDIYIVAYNHIYNEKTKNYIEPLNDYISAEKIADIAENVSDFVTFDDLCYAYPYFVEPSTMLFYSKSALTKAGVTHPTTSWTWDELLAAAEKIKPTLSSGQYALGMPLGGDVGWATWGMLHNAMDGFPITDNWDESRIEEKMDEYIEFLEFYDSIYDNGYSPIQSLTAGYGDIINALCEEKLAMTVAGSWSFGIILNNYPDKFDDIGLIPMPTKDGDSTKVTATNGGWAFVIDKKSKNKEKAGKVIEWLFANSDLEFSSNFYELSGFARFPARTSVINYINEKGIDNEFYEVIKQVSNNAVSEPLYPWDVSLKVATSLSKIIIGLGPGETLTQIANDAHNGINEIITVQRLKGTNPKFQD